MVMTSNVQPPPALAGQDTDVTRGGDITERLLISPPGVAVKPSFLGDLNCNSCRVRTPGDFGPWKTASVSICTVQRHRAPKEILSPAQAPDPPLPSHRCNTCLTGQEAWLEESQRCAPESNETRQASLPVQHSCSVPPWSVGTQSICRASEHSRRRAECAGGAHRPSAAHARDW